MKTVHRLIGWPCVLLMACVAVAVANEPRPGPVHELVVAHPPLDRSGDARRGKASFYAQMFAGRKMADGTPMRPHSNNAASKTLPLGTTAKVTNLETGQSAFVTIRDRGPYIRGRIVDLSPTTARQIGLSPKNGVAKVEVAPISVPLADGTIKLVANARNARLLTSND
jgi:rare lipoprotein A